MTTTLFDATRDLIIVEARVWRSLESVPVSLAIDTGSSEIRSIEGQIRVERAAS